MEIIGIMLTLIQMCVSLIVFLKLHIVYIPLIIIELVGIKGALAGTIMTVSILLWLYTVVKSIINFFRK